MASMIMEVRQRLKIRNNHQFEDNFKRMKTVNNTVARNNFKNKVINFSSIKFSIYLAFYPHAYSTLQLYSYVGWKDLC